MTDLRTTLEITYNTIANTSTDHLKNHPRLLQLAFVTTLLLSQAGAVAANAGDATAGP
ncbi:DUF7503 family protein [Halorussus salinus]|uniref:DUF7503 family protein n=1 Tax=Halorussus salinus TaxID=1364935 RepID=UPI00138F9A7D|nr:hypothetical protein [Halorussus salinus]